MNGIYLLLGTNLGNRVENLKYATQLLSEKDILILEESSVYETAPWGIEDQPWFLNVVLMIETPADPINLLRTCLEVEKLMGRERKERWGERSIDIDILFYHDEIIQESDLVLPHPEIANRKFTLIPLTELNSTDVHPVLKRTNAELLASCEDQLDCRLTEYKL